MQIRNSLYTALALFCVVPSAQAQGLSAQERLGYAKDTKLLIVHADDLGVSHSENMASIAVMEKGVVNSGSIMVPCPWFLEMAAWSRAHPDADLGLHLTLTSEWKTYKWGPTASRSKVLSLLDGNGYLNETVTPLVAHGDPAQVEVELRSQVELALKAGIDVTHLDEHMAAAVSRAEFLKVMIKLGREYKLPVLIAREREKASGIDIDKYISPTEVVFEKLIMAEGEDYDRGMEAFYVQALTHLPAGLNILLLHAAYDGDEMRAMTAGYPYYGAAWRQADLDFFLSRRAKELIAAQKIKLITWRELRDKLVRPPAHAPAR
ncbi:MAG: ChbG/HpnK family deacetylase [Myxococcaceae bacterium]|nr:ChbG/HpnK family deacetylase [Myxococcaceae bacterium]